MIYRGHKIELNERPKFWEASIYFYTSNNLYSYVFRGKSGNNTADDVVFEAKRLVDQGGEAGYLNPATRRNHRLSE